MARAQLLTLIERDAHRDKRELLAAKRHLERWAMRNERYGEDIGGGLGRAGFIDDLDASKMIARWAYRQSIGGHAWVATKGQTEPMRYNVSGGSVIFA